jgi:hypothetical protein
LPETLSQWFSEIGLLIQSRRRWILIVNPHLGL